MLTRLLRRAHPFSAAEPTQSRGETEGRGGRDRGGERMDRGGKDRREEKKRQGGTPVPEEEH